MAAASATDRTEYDTSPKLLLHNADIYGNRPAMREKDLGIWQSWTWKEVLEIVRNYAHGLKKLGLKPGDKVAIVGDNRPRLYWTFAAVQSIGAIPVPNYQDSVADEMVFVLKHAEVTFAIVENQEQVDKVLSVADQLPKLRKIVYDDDRGLQEYDSKDLHSFEQVIEIGRKEIEKNPKLTEKWEAGINKRKGTDVAVFLYTSGTTGRPKGVVLSYDNILISARNGNAFDNLDETEEVLAYLPMAWVGDHIFSYGQSYTAGFCVSCPESRATINEDRREIGPTYFFAPPRVFEIMLTQITVNMEDASKFNRWMYKYFMDVAKRSGEKILNGESVSFMERLKYWLGELFVYGPLKNQMGLSRLKVGYTAGEAIGPEIFSFYRSLGLNLKQLYGQTEAGVYVTVQPDGEIRADTVGKPAPEVEIKIDENGEVLYRSPGVFLEYYKNKAATREAKTKDGWVFSGDAGFFDDTGHLHVIDRAKDVGKLKDGTLFPPKYIENKLKFFSNIQEAVAFGDGRDYCAMFINIDLTSVSNWAEKNNVIYGSYQELAAHPDVYSMIEEHVREVNEQLAGEGDLAGAQIKRFLVLHKELDPDDGEITRTAKVRRGFVGERYKPLVDALYDPKNYKQHISTEVTFEDGRKGKLAADVEIRDVQSVDVPRAQMQEAAE
jgi:long-chain acyl-CoA synthetase